MAAGTTEDITGLLAAWSEGDQEALRHLVSVVYPEIRRIARRYLRRSVPDGWQFSDTTIRHLKLLPSPRLGALPRLMRSFLQDRLPIQGNGTARPATASRWRLRGG
jgi:hypothetical protein